MNYFNKLITILGPTAVGKTKFASQLAFNFNGEIISADSRQVYRKMDIGTGKDYGDYIVKNVKIPFHLIDILDPSNEFNLFLFKKLFIRSYEDIVEREKLPFLVGGTGLYISSVIQDYSLKKVDFKSDRARELETLSVEKLISILQNLHPKLHNTTDLINKDRIIKAILIAEKTGEEYIALRFKEVLVIGLNEKRDVVKNRIRDRLKNRLENGMVEEVEKLLASGISHEKLRFFGLEYKFLSLYLSGELNYNDMYQKLASAIIQFSKRQMTWFRKIEKEGIKINWVNNQELDKASHLINSYLT